MFGGARRPSKRRLLVDAERGQVEALAVTLKGGVEGDAFEEVAACRRAQNSVVSS